MLVASMVSRSRQKSTDNATEGTVMDYTHYDYLELPPGASAARIEAAYQTLLQRMKADTEPTLLSRMQQAYIVLSDANLREAYDALLQRISDEADMELQVVLDQNTTRLPRRVQDIPAPLIAVLSAWAA
jgi:curved DNA-binding protein CbpA